MVRQQGVFERRDWPSGLILRQSLAPWTMARWHCVGYAQPVDCLVKSGGAASGDCNEQAKAEASSWIFTHIQEVRMRHKSSGPPQSGTVETVFDLRFYRVVFMRENLKVS